MWRPFLPSSGSPQPARSFNLCTKRFTKANIGKNKDTPNEQAATDYVACVQALHDTVDYFVVNVSSPNTPGLWQLQERESRLAPLQLPQRANYAQRTVRPLLLKIAPDSMNEQLDEIVVTVKGASLSRVAAANGAGRK